MTHEDVNPETWPIQRRRPGTRGVREQRHLWPSDVWSVAPEAERRRV